MRSISVIFWSLILLVGCFLLGSAGFVWIGHGIYEMIKTDLGFFEILFKNGAYLVGQLIIGGVFAGVGFNQVRSR